MTLDALIEAGVLNRANTIVKYMALENGVLSWGYRTGTIKLSYFETRIKFLLYKPPFRPIVVCNFTYSDTGNLSAITNTYYMLMQNTKR